MQATKMFASHSYKENNMKRFIERFEAMAMAVAFAEVGEWKTAESIMQPKPTRTQTVDKKNGKQTRKQTGMRVY